MLINFRTWQLGLVEQKRPDYYVSYPVFFQKPDGTAYSATIDDVVLRVVGRVGYADDKLSYAAAVSDFVLNAATSLTLVTDSFAYSVVPLSDVELRSVRRSVTVSDSAPSYQAVLSDFVLEIKLQRGMASDGLSYKSETSDFTLKVN